MNSMGKSAKSTAKSLKFEHKNILYIFFFTFSSSIVWMDERNSNRTTGHAHMHWTRARQSAAKFPLGTLNVRLSVAPLHLFLSPIQSCRVCVCACVWLMTTTAEYTEKSNEKVTLAKSRSTHWHHCMHAIEFQVYAVEQYLVELRWISKQHTFLITNHLAVTSFVQFILCTKSQNIDAYALFHLL